ncbi:MarR family transcriptional regulator [Pseudalkalibacillus berkeleyi]|uniref:MarR family transcriptional regulator n=1 Tax=Pseudalkalibacillus berkeleyi TaxID=1069813 RepID=A0ABS9H198_9BACL|nr:MarR family transcriptional regulator [Pseudalkalibacillus berkeleyi]MCF6137801.1 MarR family transcriptional regulator [Pseudalkalibacillus berkeleyi]
MANMHMMMNYLRGAYKVLEEEWQKSARSIGLTQAEQHVLWIVHLEKEATITKIASIGLWDVSTVMQVITRLKQKGFITLTKKVADRRVSYALLTELGEQKIQESYQFSYKLYDYLEDYSKQSDDNLQFLKQLMEFHKDLNQYFHGSDFIDWTERTSKTLHKEG